MATAHQSGDQITQATAGTVQSRVPREVRDEVCRYAARLREEGAAWAVIARQTSLDARKLRRWNARARPAPSVPVLRPVEVLPRREPTQRDADRTERSPCRGPWEFSRLPSISACSRDRPLAPSPRLRVHADVVPHLSDS